MDLKLISIGLKAIIFDITLNPGSTDESVAVEERRVTAHEAPLPELTAAFGKLPPVFCEILELPADYQTGISIYKMAISRTKAGTRSVKLWAKKQLESRTDYLHTMFTPVVQIDKPADGESGEVQVKDKKHVALLLKALHEAERYAKGERSQQILNFNEAKAALNATADQGQQQLAGV